MAQDQPQDHISKKRVLYTLPGMNDVTIRSQIEYRRSGESALTGPVARGDAGTVKAHARALREHDGGTGGDVLAAYLAMAQATARRAEGRGLLKPDQADNIRTALEDTDDDGQDDGRA